MTGPRPQGRPRASECRIGREKLLEKAREAMGRPPRTELQRRDVADIAGVTPALVNYYFPEKWLLIEAAALPIIEDYVAKVTELVDSDADHIDKLRGLIHIYLVFNEDNGFLLEYYIDAMFRQNDAEGIRLLWRTHAKITCHIQDLVRRGDMREVNPELINSVLWGICRYVAGQSRDRASGLFPGEDTHDPRAHRSRVICDLLLNGLIP